MSSILFHATVDHSGLTTNDYSVNASVRINKRKHPPVIYEELPLAASFFITAGGLNAPVSSAIDWGQSNVRLGQQYIA